MKTKIYIEFYLDNNSSLNKHLYNLDNFINELFDSQAKLVHISPDDNERLKSVIYSFKKPVIKTFEETVELFENLKQIFEVYKGCSPHFTQFEELKDFDSQGIIEAKEIFKIFEEEKEQLSDENINKEEG